MFKTVCMCVYKYIMEYEWYLKTTSKYLRSNSRNRNYVGDF